ncbi:MAG: hypothetical protein NWF13_08100 [Candidatus Bathyarchaeota archaeon]|nr:hypothetical protein [Candidatus Bathyarchaeota archaeon]
MKADEVIRNVEKHFQKKGFELHRSWILDKRGEIRRVTRRAGVDLIAKRSDELWLVEAKGERKRKAGYSVAINVAFGQLISRIKIFDHDEKIHYAISLPYPLGHFEVPLKRFADSQALSILKIHLFLIHENGEVTHKTPNQFIDFLQQL